MTKNLNQNNKKNKMKKDLLLEIKRMQEMMGLNPMLSLIMEAGPGIPEPAAENIWRAFRNAFRTGEKTLEKGIERVTEKEIEETIDKMKSVVGEELVKPLEEIMSKRITAAEKSLEISRVFETNKILADEIADKLKLTAEYAEKMNEVFDEFFAQTEVRNEMYEMYKQAVERAGGDVEAAKEVMREIWEQDLGKDRLDRFFETTEVKEKNGEIVIEPKNKIEVEVEPEIEDNFDSPENGTETNGGDGPGLDSDEALNDIKQSAGKGTNSIWQSIVRSFNLNDIQSVLRAWRRAFRTMEQLQTEFNELAERVSEKMKKGEDYRGEYNKMKDVLLACKKWWQQKPELFFKEWEKELPKNVQKLLSDFRLGGTAKDWNEFQTALFKETEVFDPIKTEVDAYRKLWPFRFPGGKSEGWFIFKKPSPDLRKRVGNLIVMKDPRTFAEMKQALITNGVKQDIARTITAKVLTEMVVGPAYLATIGLIFRPAIAGMEGVWNSLPWTSGDANWIDFNEPNEKGERAGNVKEILKNDWKQVFNELTPEGSEWITTLIDPTYIDETWNDIVWPLIEKNTLAQKEIEDSQIRQALTNYQNIHQAEYQEWYKNLTESQKAVINRYLERIRSKNPSFFNDFLNTEQSFKIWCTGNGKNFKEWKGSSSTGFVGVTTDNNEWVFDDKQKTFVSKSSPNPQPVVPQPVTTEPVTVQDKIKNSDQQWLDFVKQNNLQNKQVANDSSGIYKSNLGEYYYCPSKKTFIPSNKDFCAECPNDCP